MKPLRIFVPITKVDAAKRLVFGKIAAQEEDHAGETFDYDSSKPNFQKWSDAMSKASDGKNLGNVRVMHTAKAAGKMVDMAYNDDEKTIEGCAKIVDDDEWKKVEEGIYTGFSMGGSYARKWKDAKTGANMYTANPVEVSLVDAPCIKSATFDYIKADLTHEMRKFIPWEPSSAEIAAKATELAKAGTGSTWVDHIEAARKALVDTRAGMDAPIDAEMVKAMERTVTKETHTTHEKMDDGAAAGAQAKDENKVTGDNTQNKGDNEGDNPKKGDDAKVDGLAGENEEADDDGKAPAKDAKAAGDKKDEEEVEKARTVVAQKWLSTDGKPFDKKEDCVKHQLTLDKPVNALTKAVAELTTAVKGDVKPEDPLRKVLEARPEGTRDLALFAKLLPMLEKAATDQKGDVLRKSMWDVGSFASVLMSLSNIQSTLQYEAEREKDSSAVPMELKTQIASLVSTFLKVAAEESAEMLASMPGGEMITIDATADPEVAVAAANAYKAIQPDVLAKVGARNSGADKKRLQGMHDYLVELGVACAPETAEKLAKAVGENATLEKVISDALPAIEALKKDIELLKAQPMPGGPSRLNVVEKGGAQEPVAAGTNDFEALMSKLTPDQISMALIKLAQQGGKAMHDRGTIKG